MGFGEENHRGKVPLSSHQKKGEYYQHDLMLTLITRLRQCESEFSGVRLLSSRTPSFPGRQA